MTTNDDTERIPEHAFFGQATRKEAAVCVRQAAIIKQLEARVDALTAALTPFANAAKDEGVQDANRMTCLLLEDRTFGHHTLIYSTPAKSGFLTVKHLRDAADALKGGAK